MIDSTSAALLRFLDRECRRATTTSAPSDFRLASLDSFEREPPSRVTTVALAAVEVDEAGGQAGWLAREADGAPSRGIALQLRYLLTPWYEDPGTQQRILADCVAVLADGVALGHDDFEPAPTWLTFPPVEVRIDNLKIEQLLRLFEGTGARYRVTLPLLVRPVMVMARSEETLVTAVHLDLGEGAQ